MARKTPIERVIAQETDRQARYEARRRKEGLTKTCVWVPAGRAEELKALARQWVAEALASDGSPDPVR